MRLNIQPNQCDRGYREVLYSGNIYEPWRFSGKKQSGSRQKRSRRQFLMYLITKHSKVGIHSSHRRAWVELNRADARPYNVRAARSMQAWVDRDLGWLNYGMAC
jgi:uncharacterized LabA/DUF88 family protein